MQKVGRDIVTTVFRVVPMCRAMRFLTCFPAVAWLNNTPESYSPTTQTTKIAAPKAKNDNMVITDLAPAEGRGAVWSLDSGLWDICGIGKVCPEPDISEP